MAKLIKWSKLSRHRLFKLIECFCLDIEASKTAVLLRLNRNTVNRHDILFRRLISRHQLAQLRRFVGVVEADESYFGPARLRGRPGGRKRGRGTWRQPVFGIYERQGRVYTRDRGRLLGPCSPAHPARGKVDPQSVLFTDGWLGYDGLVDVGYDKQVRINQNKAFARGRAHVNGIEAFWSFTKRRLAKFNGVKKLFPLHLKECEWRYSQSLPSLKASLLSILKSKL